jgi:V/A-type H+/Na+-transporting ATPase subunit D
MKVRHPTGRAGRPWLAHRLEVARRGAELLAEKQHALLREHARLEPLLAQARSNWELRAPEAERWLARAAMLGGERQLDFVPGALAELTVGWRTILGVRCRADPQLELPAERELVPAGASAEVYGAAAAQRRALEAAVPVSVAERALERVETDLRAAGRRLGRHPEHLGVIVTVSFSAGLPVVGLLVLGDVCSRYARPSHSGRSTTPDEIGAIASRFREAAEAGALNSAASWGGVGVWAWDGEGFRGPMRRRQG